MWDYERPLDSRESDEKFDRYRSAFQHLGFTRWAIETPQGAFIGYAGVMPLAVDHPLGRHFDIGWRLARDAWGKGFATEASQAALQDAFQRCGLIEVLSYTAADNLRSQAVMKRLNLRRDSSRDFDHPDGRRIWRGLVWVAEPDQLQYYAHEYLLG